MRRPHRRQPGSQILSRPFSPEPVGLPAAREQGFPAARRSCDPAEQPYRSATARAWHRAAAEGHAAKHWRTPSCASNCRSRHAQLLPNQGVDQVHFADLEGNAAISAAGACVNVHLAHIGSESTERFIYSKARSVAREKYGRVGAGQVCNVEDGAEKTRAGLTAQSWHPPDWTQLHAKATELNDKNDSEIASTDRMTV